METIKCYFKDIPDSAHKSIYKVFVKDMMNCQYKPKGLTLNLCLLFVVIKFVDITSLANFSLTIIMSYNFYIGYSIGLEFGLLY